MSRAFTKERDDAPEPRIDVRDRTKSVRMTQHGYDALAERIAQSGDDTERAKLEMLLAQAVVVRTPVDRAVIDFGATAQVATADGTSRSFTIVGEEESNVAAGLVSESSPLAQSLLGAKVGQEVTWHRPAGDQRLRVISITYDGA
ncbi:MAG: hypothetical protein DLM50_07320 [Candidatus Meridianibacter frigidus]|nr:MAG: hypothetical protein DLM50_07320 [Candidatus Eremiobacteraeota bacterium]